MGEGQGEGGGRLRGVDEYLVRARFRVKVRVRVRARARVGTSESVTGRGARVDITADRRCASWPGVVGVAHRLAVGDIVPGDASDYQVRSGQERASRKVWSEHWSSSELAPPVVNKQRGIPIQLGLR